MIFTDYLKGEQLAPSLTRYDVTASTESYDLLEDVFKNKKGFNVDGLSFHLTDSKMYNKRYDQSIGKNNFHVSGLKKSNIQSHIFYGDIKGTNDACIIIFNPDYRELGKIIIIEIFIARGYAHDTTSLINRVEFEDLEHEFNALRQKAVTKIVTSKK